MVTLPIKLLNIIDMAKGDSSRSRWIQRASEEKLRGTKNTEPKELGTTGDEKHD